MQAQDLPESITSMTPEPGWSHSSACAVQQSVMGRGVHGGSKSTPLFLRTACTRHAASTAAFAAWHHCSLTMTELTSSMQGACQHMRVLARQGRAWVCPRGWAGGARCSRFLRWQTRQACLCASEFLQPWLEWSTCRIGGSWIVSHSRVPSTWATLLDCMGTCLWGKCAPSAPFSVCHMCIRTRRCM